MCQFHLDQEAAHVGPENGVDGMFFAGEDLLHRPHFPARYHVQTTVIDRRAGLDSALIVVRHKGEVDPVSAGDAQVIRSRLLVGIV